MKKHITVLAVLAAASVLFAVPATATAAVTAAGSATSAAAVKIPPKATAEELSVDGIATTTAAFLQFRAVTGATDYKLYVQNADKTYTLIDTAASEKTDELNERYVSYNIGGLKAGTTYKFKVSAVINYVSAKSAEISVTTAKSVFTGDRARNIAGRFVQSHTGDIFTFNSDGTGVLNSDNTVIGGFKSQGFVYAEAITGGHITVRIIGTDFSFSAYDNGNGTWDLLPEMSGRSYTLKPEKS